MGILGFKIYKAKMFDEKGNFLKDVWFPKFDKTFNFRDKSFNIKHNEASYFDKKGLLFDVRYYFYNLTNPDPLILNKKVEPIMSPEMYNIQLETSVAKKLNDLSKTKITDLLNGKIIIIGLILLIVGVLYFTGNLGV